MNITKKRHISSLLLAVLIAVGVSCHDFSPCQAATEPLAQLHDAVSQILDILRRDVPGEQWVTKKEEIVRIVKSRFDADELAQRVLALNWKARSSEERQQFVSLFSQVLETTYINRLRSYSDEDVIFKKQIITNDKAVVYSEIIKNNQEIPIVYRVKDNNGQWLIYDIIIEGVSLVQNYRQQFEQIIKSEDYAGLVRRMQEKIEENRKKDIEEGK